MDKKYTTGWTGLQKSVMVARVCKIRNEMNSGDTFQTIENTSLGNMTDTNRQFLQHHAVFPDKKSPGQYQRFVIFANPNLLGHLQGEKVDAFMDATFSCCPLPFYQCLIFVIFHRETNCYVPILYELMTHQNQELYCGM